MRRFFTANIYVQRRSTHNKNSSPKHVWIANELHEENASGV